MNPCPDCGTVPLALNDDGLLECRHCGHVQKPPPEGLTRAREILKAAKPPPEVR